MKRLFFTIVIQVIFSSSSLNAQENAQDTCNCTAVMKELSYYWKLDSLTGNGFGKYTYDKLLKCKRDKVYRALLLEKLGKPNQIWKTNKGIEYIYCYFDINAMPKDYDAPVACFYIVFKFGEYDKYLTEIEAGDVER